MPKSVISIPLRGTVEFDRFAPVISPPAPTLLTVTPGNMQNDLTWSASSGAISYKVFFSTSPGVTTGDTSISLGNVTSFSHTSLLNGTTYYYRIQAIGSGGGESALSNELSATPSAATFANDSSLELNGANQYGIIPFSQTTPLQFSRVNERTYSFWVYWTGGNVCIWDHRIGSNPATGAGTYIGIEGSNLLVNIGSNFDNIQKTAIQSFPQNQWTHVCVVYAGNSNVSGIDLYVNGAVLATTTTGTTLSGPTTYSNTNNLLIGARGAATASGGGAGRYFDGFIDEFSVFSTDFNSTEVNELYNSGSPDDLLNHSQTANLVGWWRFGDMGDTASIVFDQTTNNMDINLINSPSYSTTEVP